MIRVLCVEDEELVRRFLQTRLGMEPDIEVVAAVPDAETACSYLRREPFDVVVLDYQLEGSNGMQLLHTITLWLDDQFSSAFPRPAAIFCTGYATPELEREATAMGALAVVSKERAMTDLVPAIRAAAQGRPTPSNLTLPIEDTAMPTRVLIAENDRPARAHLTGILQNAGYDVTLAWSGGDIVRLLERDQFELVMLDHRLPGRPSTIEALEEIEVRWPELPVLLLGTPPPGMEHYRPTQNVRGLVSKLIGQRQLLGELDRAGVVAERAAACF